MVGIGIFSFSLCSVETDEKRAEAWGVSGLYLLPLLGTRMKLQ